MEPTQIEHANAIRLAALTVEVAYLKTGLARLDVVNAAQSETLTRISNQLAEARGGWKTLMLIGGAAGTLGSAATWFFSHLKG